MPLPVNLPERPIATVSLRNSSREEGGRASQIMWAASSESLR